MREQLITRGKQVIATGMATLALTFMIPVVANADEVATSSESKQAEANAALEKLNGLRTQLDEASNTYFSALSEQEAAQNKMDEAQETIDQETQKIEEFQGKLGTRARSMYRSGTSSMLELLLGSTTFEEFATNWDILNDMNEQDATLVSDTKQSRETLEDAKQEYTEQRDVAAEKTAEAASTKATAEAATAEVQATYDSLSAEALQLLEQERAAQQAAAAAESQRVLEEAAAHAQQTYAEAAQNAAESGDNADNGAGEAVSDGGDAPAAESGSSDGGYVAPPVSEPSYNAGVGGTAVERAQSYVGQATYVWGACSPGAFDCSGFVSYCLTGEYSRLGTTYTFLGWPEVSDPQPGDVAVNEQHCGIYIGGGMMIDCAGWGTDAAVRAINPGMTFHRY